MKLKQNSFKTVLKLFRFCFISLCGQFKSNTVNVIIERLALNVLQ